MADFWSVSAELAQLSAANEAKRSTELSVKTDEYPDLFPALPPVAGTSAPKGVWGSAPAVKPSTATEVGLRPSPVVVFAINPETWCYNT